MQFTTSVVGKRLLHNMQGTNSARNRSHSAELLAIITIVNNVAKIKEIFR